MLNFKVFAEHIETDLNGKNLLTTPQLNKSTAFSRQERQELGLLGKLPPRIESLQEQVDRAWLQFSRYQTDMQKHIYLNNLHDKNQVLFYQLVLEHIEEMVPLIYTPCIGTAVEEYSHEFRQARGLFISDTDQDHIEEILDNRSNPEIDIIVVTDGEGVLGIGDQGVGGINIPIAKLMIYTLFAGIHPLRTLPIYLDVGTNNPQLLADPFYLGQRHTRLSTTEYDVFMEKFVSAIHRKFPHAFLHWEDFGRNHAYAVMKRYQNQHCSFNDDIQGTGAVTVAALLAAVKNAGSTLTDQRIVIFGAGTAGAGIAGQIHDALCRMGLSETEAWQKFWLVDRKGLLLDNDPDLTDAQRPYARNAANCQHWQRDAQGYINLEETVRQTKATILIGCSSQSGAFNEQIVRQMAAGTNYPIIFPLSNPNNHAEATPQQLIEWTAGKALIATGSPFAPITWQGATREVAQCNNALAFPGIGLGIVATKASRCTDNMLWAACQALSETAPAGMLLPSLTHAREAALSIACAVARQAMQENVAQTTITGDIRAHIQQMMWKPAYLPIRKFNPQSI